VGITAWLCLLVSVPTFPPDSVDTLDPTLGWLFSLPTLAFCFLLCDALGDTPPDSFPPRRGASLTAWFRWLRVAFVVLGVLPLVVYLVGWDWLTIPTAVAAVLTNIVLVFLLWAAGEEPEEDAAASRVAALRERRQTSSARAATASPESAPAPPAAAVERSSPEPGKPKAGGRRKKIDGQFDAEAVKQRVRREREAWEKQRGEQPQD